jgi:hypothetical protein
MPAVASVSAMEPTNVPVATADATTRPKVTRSMFQSPGSESTEPPRKQAEQVKASCVSATPVIPQLGYSKPATGVTNPRARGRRVDGVQPSQTLKEYRQHPFAGIPFAVAHARCFFAAMKKISMMGFRCPSDFFSPTQATSKARRKQRKGTDRPIAIGTCFIDFKGRFVCSRTEITPVYWLASMRYPSMCMRST